MFENFGKLASTVEHFVKINDLKSEYEEMT